MITGSSSPLGVRLGLALCMLVFGLPTAQAFNLTGISWLQGETDFNVNFPDHHADENPLIAGSSSLEELQAEFLSSMAEWNQRSTFRFNPSTNTPAVDPCGNSGNGAEISDTVCGRAFGGATLAVQRSQFSNGAAARTTIVFNSSLRWEVFSGFRPGSTDFRRVALHELGHSLGLDHEDDGRASIMTSRISNTRALQQDDLNGAAALYDLDQDGVGFAMDNCREVNNPDQSDLDFDDVGDDCDSDIDNDGVFNSRAIDQAHANQPNDLSLSAFPSTSNQFLAQTFTVGITGKLQSVVIPVRCSSGSLTVQIRSVAGNGRPSGTVLDFIQYADGLPASIGGRITADLNIDDADDIEVVVDQRLAIVIVPSGICFWTTAASTQGYSRGAGYFSTGGGFSNLNRDLPFAVNVDPSVRDNCPRISNSDQADANMDGVGDVCEATADSDMDGVFNVSDNCRFTPNPLQENSDLDPLGDACDEDDDNDEVLDGLDNCQSSPNPLQEDLDEDGDGDACDSDIDNDNVSNGADDNAFNPFSCSDVDSDFCNDCSTGVFSPSNDGIDTDSDGLCDLGDPNDDNDQFPDSEDNCDLIANDQTDSNGDGVGDACEDASKEELCVPIVVQGDSTAEERVVLICL